MTFDLTLIGGRGIVTDYPCAILVSAVLVLSCVQTCRQNHRSLYSRDYRRMWVVITTDNKGLWQELTSPEQTMYS